MREFRKRKEELYSPGGIAISDYNDWASIDFEAVAGSMR